ncbi:MAG: hypothetical protein ABW191_00040 [Aliihoeflea sp.]
MARRWDDFSARSRLSDTSAGILRVTLLFGSAAIALTLILVPLADRHTSQRSVAAVPPQGVDMMSTGSIAARGSDNYTIRRSVLQPNPNAVCIIRDTGERIGAC